MEGCLYVITDDKSLFFSLGGEIWVNIKVILRLSGKKEEPESISARQVDRCHDFSTSPSDELKLSNEQIRELQTYLSQVDIQNRDSKT